MPYNIVLWGLGKYYRTYRNYLKQLENTGVIHVGGVFSVDNFEMSEIDGWHYYVYEDIRNVSFDYLLILNEAHEQDIIDNLLEANIEREKIIPGRILDLPNFDFEKYIQLKKSRISIISRTCLGGMLSRTIGLEYLSPFKNMRIGEEDYIKLLNNFEEYMKYDLVYSGEQLFNADEQIYYPVMNLNDIRIEFTHTKRASKAILEWNERKERINRSSLFVINLTEREDIARQFSKIPFEHKACFTNFRSDIPNTIFIPPCRTWKTQAPQVHYGVGNGLLFVDPVKLLIGEDDFILFS